MDYLIFPDAIHMRHQQNPKVWEYGLDWSVGSSATAIKRNLELLVWSEVHSFVRSGKAWSLWIMHRAKIRSFVFGCFSSPASSLIRLLAQHVVLALALYWLTCFRGPFLMRYTVPGTTLEQTRFYPCRFNCGIRSWRYDFLEQGRLNQHFSSTLRNEAVTPVHLGNQSMGGTPPFLYCQPQFCCSSLSNKM